MDWGLQNRISRIIKPNDNRALMLAVDHGYFLGPTEKLEVPRKTIAPLLKYCDSIMLTRGVQQSVFFRCGFCVKINYNRFCFLL